MPPLDISRLWHMLPDKEVTLREALTYMSSDVHNKEGARIALVQMVRRGWAEEIEKDKKFKRVHGDWRPRTEVEYFWWTLPSHEKSFTSAEAAEAWKMTKGGAARRLEKLEATGIVTSVKRGPKRYSERDWTPHEQWAKEFMDWLKMVREKCTCGCKEEE